MSTREGSAETRAAAERARRLHAVRAGVERATAAAGAIEDAVLVVVSAAPEDVRGLARGDAVDLLLDLGERRGARELKPLAARLLVHPSAPPGELLAALVEPGEAPWLGTITRPELARERARRAQEEIAALCIERRGLAAPTTERPVRFAVRAHGCSLCTSWAMVLGDFGVDLAPLTAPDAGRARVRKVGAGALCAGCELEREDVLAIARRADLDETRAVAAMMPSAVLAHLDLARARALRNR